MEGCQLEKETSSILKMSVSDKSKELDYGLEYGNTDACANNGQSGI